MHYIEQKDNEFVKYEVTIDQTELEKIKYEVIENCGEVTHHSFQSDYAPRNLDFYHIFNYSYNYVGTKEYFEETREVYQYEYDEHSDTRLVTLIDQILKGDLSIISELKDPRKQEKQKDNTGENIKKKLKQLLSLDTEKISTWQLEKVKKEIEEYQINEKLNRDRKSDLEYYPRVLTCIEMKEIARMKIDKIQQIENLMIEIESIKSEVKPFFRETDSKNITTDGYQKVISKIYSK